MVDEDKRTQSIRVRLSPGQMERLTVLAKRLGMPPATLGALGVNRFIDEEWSRIWHLEQVQQGNLRLIDGEWVALDPDEGHHVG